MNEAGERGSAPTIRLDALTKFYGPNRGVEDLTLDVMAGEVLGFLGPNGAGKTTALRLLMGLLRPTSGRAEVMGFDTMRESVEVRRRVGYLPGDPSLYGNRNGNELLKLAMRTREIDRAPLAERLIETLNAPMERDIRKCSRGMRQKVALVLALGHDPEVLVLDEPTTGLDPLGQRAMLSFLRERAEAGRTVLLSSHMLSEVEQVCERVAILREGKLRRLDTVEALREEKFREVTVDFDGEAPSFEGIGEYEVVWQEAKRMIVRVRGDARALLAALAAAQITDVSITEPTLEEVFLDYYRDGDSQ